MLSYNGVPQVPMMSMARNDFEALPLSERSKDRNGTYVRVTNALGNTEFVPVNLVNVDGILSRMARLTGFGRKYR